MKTEYDVSICSEKDRVLHTLSLFGIDTEDVDNEGLVELWQILMRECDKAANVMALVEQAKQVMELG